MEIIPAILTNDPLELKEKIRRLTWETRGEIRRVQIDVVDGVFAKDKTVGVEELAGVESDLLWDIQLMVEEPKNWIQKCVKVEAGRVIGHVEQMGDIWEFVDGVKEMGMDVGLGLDIHTPLRPILGMLPEVDVVLLMAVEAGKGGQEFCDEVVEKIMQLTQMRKVKGLDLRICVDGGVNEENIELLEQLGVDEVAVGKRLWVGGDVRGNIEQMRRIAEGEESQPLIEQDE